jgi:hypothetical protein
MLALFLVHYETIRTVDHSFFKSPGLPIHAVPGIVTPTWRETSATSSTGGNLVNMPLYRVKSLPYDWIHE